MFKMPARIYKPSRNAMQSGKGKSQDWVLEFEQASPRAADPLMGWTSSDDTTTQVKLKFATLDDAESYAKRNGIAYQVQAEAPVKQQKKSYSDNFKFGRTENWTH
jgi:ETC complex I subunit conserved region